ncbi:uncharacterized protein MELLADRAFT_40209 [Melampsora larici-populina 98AG31]|uniref:Amino acid permease n=1 Tax=Melampsora larici-populina (strain 98AG31 / pathotype 3-4-7) TaxID=747676 RepID=F4S721_MELLP|nr:uncharacterized protein MELLADRAFT_40209 [Melampsora larici-populina 98AG31]EGF99585.1 hypothetical protein MELLADRAFT_40209 [Melampsora larici-populina 98AG31]
MDIDDKRNSKVVIDETFISTDQPLTLPSSEDEKALAALGYKQEFKREFGLWTTFGVSFSVMGLLPSYASVMLYGLTYAGTGGMAWGWIVAMIPIQCIACSLAELCSSMPTSGGLYYASAVLAPDGFGPLAAWLTGWSNWIAQISGAPSVDYALSSMILAGVSITHPTYTPTNPHTFILTAVIMLIQATISSLPTKTIATLNGYGTLLNFAALFITIFVIPLATTRAGQVNPSTGEIMNRVASSSEVWGSIHNGTDYPDGVSILMSFIGVIWIMSGYDASFHLSEECSNANIAAPRAIVMTSSIGGIIGWIIQIIVAYTIIDIDRVLDSSLAQPWAAYLLQVLPQRAALAILSLTIGCSFFMGQACMIAGSRVAYAYARDDCFGPFSKIVKVVNSKTKTPVNAVWFNTFIGIIILLLVFGGPLAINAIFSIGGIAAMVAFAIPISMRVFIRNSNFQRGPWHLGKFGKPIGALGAGFVALMVPIMCLPAKTGSRLNAENMNWTCMVYGGWMTFISLWWIFNAKKWFKGPKIQETEIISYEIEKGFNRNL